MFIRLYLFLFFESNFLISRLLIKYTKLFI